MQNILMQPNMVACQPQQHQQAVAPQGGARQLPAMSANQQNRVSDPRFVGRPNSDQNQNTTGQVQTSPEIIVARAAAQRDYHADVRRLTQANMLGNNGMVLGNAQTVNAVQQMMLPQGRVPQPGLQQSEVRQPTMAQPGMQQSMVQGPMMQQPVTPQPGPRQAMMQQPGRSQPAMQQPAM